MSEKLNRRDFIKTTSTIAGLSYLPFSFSGCVSQHRDYLYTPEKYDIFFKYKIPKVIYQYDTNNLTNLFPNNTPKKLWLLRSIISIFQGLINRENPGIYLKHSPKDVDWLSIYKEEKYQFEFTEVTDFSKLLAEFSPFVNGYIVIDPHMLDTLNIAQTWGSLENWMVVTPEMEPLAKEHGLTKKQDLQGRWQDRVTAYEWAFENLFPNCSKHIVGDCCIDFPFHPTEGSFHIRDFLVANKAFTFDLSAALRQRREYKLLDKIYEALEFPSGVWGWHDSRDHEHWAVDRAARKGVYTICAAGGPNLTVHGGFKPGNLAAPKQKASTRKNLKAEKDKIYIAFMMTDGDALWVMDRLQLNNWATKKVRNFPMTWGFLPLLADIAPAMYMYYIHNMQKNDYMVAGPSGAAYTYPHMYPEPRQFLKYTKFYMQKCGLEIVNLTNWNDYTNWQEVDLPEFNPLIFEELDNCLGYVRGMGESAFEPHYNFGDKPYVFCGEGLHFSDKDDVDTIKSFIDANPNRPLFIFCLNNIAITMERIKKVVDELQQYEIEYVRLDDFIHLVKSAYNQEFITEYLYPNRKGNEQILIKEAPASWKGTKNSIKKLIPIINAQNEKKAMDEINADKAGLAMGQKITGEDRADILAFAICENMFKLTKNVLNFKGIYVNVRKESVEKFVELNGNWEGIESFRKLMNIWENWDQVKIDWQEIIQTGKEFLKVYEQAARIFIF